MHIADEGATWGRLLINFKNGEKLNEPNRRFPCGSAISRWAHVNEKITETYNNKRTVVNKVDPNVFLTTFFSQLDVFSWLYTYSSFTRYPCFMRTRITILLNQSHRSNKAYCRPISCPSSPDFLSLNSIKLSWLWCSFYDLNQQNYTELKIESRLTGRR